MPTSEDQPPSYKLRQSFYSAKVSQLVTTVPKLLVKELAIWGQTMSLTYYFALLFIYFVHPVSAPAKNVSHQDPKWKSP
jgi:hypothetical protein